MHEMSIANSVLDALEKEARRFPGGRITKVGLRIGELAGVDPGALSFCLEAVVRETAWQPVEFEIEYSPRRHRCRRCAEEFAVNNFDIVCPSCGDPNTVFAGGDELDLTFLEVEENEPCRAATESAERE